MEFFVMRTGEVKNVELKNKKWFLYEFGITDKRGSEFLEALEENVNSLFQQELFTLAQYAGKYSWWLESKDLPFTVLNYDNASLLVCRKMSYYCTHDGRPIFTAIDWKERLVETVSDVVTRGTIVDEKERNCAMWLLSKLGIKCKWEEGDSSYEQS